jgi:kumamolisin
MSLRDKSHKKLSRSNSNFFNSLEKKERKRGQKGNQAVNMPAAPQAPIPGMTRIEDEENYQLHIRLVLEEEFSRSVIKRLMDFTGDNSVFHPGSREEYKLGATMVAAVAKRYDIHIEKERERSRIITLIGTIDNFERFFDVDIDFYVYHTEIKNCEHSTMTMGHQDYAKIPVELDGIVHSIMGLRNTPIDPQVIKPRIEINKTISAARGQTSDWMAKYYNFPRGYTGKGQHIGIISCGGGFSQEEFNTFFAAAGMEHMKPIRIVSIDGIQNDAGGNWIYDYEVATDCLVAACAAPDIEITVYFCDTNLHSFLNTLEYILDEGDAGPDIISYSWGSSESKCIADMEGVNRVLKEASLDHNKSIFCASGDFGSTNNSSRHITDRDELEVIFPGSSPWVTCCGGTMFEEDNNANSHEEVVWNSVFLYGVIITNSTGGGFSSHFDRPEYQKGVVPDLAPEGYIPPEWVEGLASVTPDGFGYWIYFQNKNWLTGGTSAVAPLWASLTARLNEALGQNLGFMNPYLYKMSGTDCFKPITKGNNALIPANTHWVGGEPWNPCAGLGVPEGEAILTWFKNNLNEE